MANVQTLYQFILFFFLLVVCLAAQCTEWSELYYIINMCEKIFECRMSVRQSGELRPSKRNGKYSEIIV